MARIILFVLLGFCSFFGCVMLFVTTHIRTIRGQLFVRENDIDISAAIMLGKLCDLKITVIKDSNRTADKDTALAIMQKKWDIGVISEDEFSYK